MHSGQPIWFDNEGKKTYGIVYQVLPAKAGVIAWVNPEEPTKVKVLAPHRVKDVAEAHKVAGLFGSTLAIAAEDEQQIEFKPKPKAKTEAQLADAFNAALAALNNPTAEDLIRLNGMGISGCQTKADPNSIPVDKMFY